MRAAARAEKSPLIKEQLYRYLASTRDESLARRALDIALTDEAGATHAAGMIGEVADEHPDLAFDFAVAYHDRVDALLAAGRSRYYPRLGADSLDAAMIGKIRRFADANLSNMDICCRYVLLSIVLAVALAVWEVLFFLLGVARYLWVVCSEPARLSIGLDNRCLSCLPTRLDPFRQSRG